MRKTKRLGLVAVVFLGLLAAAFAAPQTDCEETCLDDYIVQRNYCATLPPAQRLACYQQAQAAYEECLNDCP